ncbi:MAG: hypothetical protein IPK68_14795 [Bdellovibrionales bacterium]|nr:hypothetical protein [Bdellovibrionales bacterium]
MQKSISTSKDRESFEKKDLDFNTVVGHKPSVILLCLKNTGSCLKQISGVQDRVRLGAVLTT